MAEMASELPKHIEARMPAISAFLHVILRTVLFAVLPVLVVLCVPPVPPVLPPINWDN